MVLFLQMEVQPRVEFKPEWIQFQDGVSNTVRISASSVVEPQVKIVKVQTFHQALLAKIAADGRDVDLSFNPSEWRDGGAVFSIEVETTSAGEPKIRLPVEIRSANQ